MPRIISNTLNEHWDRWTDPGDYPSGAGGGPLPPGDPYVESVEGSLIVELSPEEFVEMFSSDNSPKEYFRSLLESHLSCTVKSLDLKVDSDNHIVLTVDDVGETVGN